MICYGKKKNINDIFKFTKHLICYNSCQSGYKKIRNCMLTGQYEYSTMYM